jgi:probable rRNA maturation factor
MSDGDQRGRLRAVVVDARGGARNSPGLTRWIAAVAPARARGLVSIAIVSDARVRALNRQYRGKDYATDVLSFPWGGTGWNGGTGRNGRMRTGGKGGRASTRSSVQPLPPPQPFPPFLGEIVIARGVARRQAQAAGHSELTELRVLALHGLLHLLGYDHERDGGRMRRLEERLRRKGGLREGLIARADRPSASRRQPSAISRQPSAISHQPSAVSHQPSAVGRRRR